MKRVAVAVILSSQGVFLQRRAPQEKDFPGAWELPGGKVEPGETPEAAVMREVWEELGCLFVPEQAMAPLVHVYGEMRVELHGFVGRASGNPTTALRHGWFKPEDWGVLGLLEATRRLLDKVEAPWEVA